MQRAAKPPAHGGAASGRMADAEYVEVPRMEGVAAEHYTEPAHLPRNVEEEETQEQSWVAFVTLVVIVLAAVTVRLFAVVRYESIIHEYDPQFNFRATQFLSDNGAWEFANWFDTRSWYPLGRWVGHTVYPGLMMTASAMHTGLHQMSLPVSLRNVCVFFAPVFAGLTAIVTYLLTKESFNRGAALAAAGFIALAPGYTSRSVAGSYDNEAVAIFALVNAFYWFVKAVKTGQLRWAAGAGVAYFFMVTTWGGYIYVANVIPLYAYAMVVLGRYTQRLYVAYSGFYVLGMLMNLLVPFVGYSHVFGPTHVVAHVVFILFQAHGMVGFLKQHLGMSRAVAVVRVAGGAALAAVGLLLLVANFTSLGSDGRFAFLLNPMGNKMAIVASVAEHQGSTWASFYGDFAVLLLLAPAGVYYCIGQWTDGALFLLAYYVSATYFASIMVRLMLVVAPAFCIMAGIAVSQTYALYLKPSRLRLRAKPNSALVTNIPGYAAISEGAGKTVAVGTLLVCLFFGVHAVWVTAEMYSSPSVIVRTNKPGGGVGTYDDFREAYYWMRQNTAEDAVFMSWWDYGYQSASMANRTNIVDNNTWNNTHIATVGKCLASSEQECYRTLRRLDVDYVFVIFGGLVGYSSDDIAKFLWMVKIAGSVYPEVKERDYYDESGHYTVGRNAPKRFLNSLMYKLSYHRFSEINTTDTASIAMARNNDPNAAELGYDRSRRTAIGRGNFSLTHFEEAFTTTNWMVRIYRVLREPVRG